MSTMQLALTRPVAYAMVEQKIGVNNLLKHILSVEAGMHAIAQRLGEDVEYWSLVGLVHDLDYNETKDEPEKHTYLTREWLSAYNLPEDFWHAIHAHPGHVPCHTKLDWALFSVDPTTGFLVAAALMHPSKSLAALEPDFLKKRFSEKRFAAGASRENMGACVNLNLELGEFLLLVRDGMLTISSKLGL